MSDDDFDSQAEELIEQYLQFLRGRAPEPDLGHLPAARRRAMRARLDLVDTMFGLDLHRPAVENDPVAIRLGLVPDPSAPPSPASAPPAAEPATSGTPEIPAAADDDDSAAGIDLVTDGGTDATDDGQQLGAVARVLEELEVAFSGQVVIDWSPAWASWRGRDLRPVAQCSVLGDALAVFVADQPWHGHFGHGHFGHVNDGLHGHDELDEHNGHDGGLDGHDVTQQSGELAGFLYQHPDVSAVSLVSSDSRYAAILPAAACNAAIDPVRGWLQPGELILTDDADLVLGRYFQARLPRWDRIAGLSEMLADDDADQQVLDTVTSVIGTALLARPRLAHKKEAQLALREVDPQAIASAILGTRTGEIGGDQLVQRLATLSRGDTS